MNIKGLFQGELWTENDKLVLDGQELIRLIRQLGLEGKQVKITVRECKIRRRYSRL